MFVSKMASLEGFLLNKRSVSTQLLTGNLVSDATLLQAFPITVDRWNEWTIVSSPSDWITKNLATSLRESFFSVQPFPEMGREMFRCNVLLATFCENVVTYSSIGEKEIIKGREDLLELEQYLSTNHAEKRIVAFSGIASKVPPPRVLA